MERCPDYEREIWLDMKAEYERKKKDELQLFLDKSFQEKSKKYNIDWKEASL